MNGNARPDDNLSTTDPVRFYFDADILGIARIMAEVRADVTYPGDSGGTVRRKTRSPCPIESPTTKDEIWIPIVADKGWSIMTRDIQISRKRAQIEAVKRNKAKLFTIMTTGKLNNWDQLEVVVTRWRDIEKIAAGEGPFIYALYRTSMRQIL